MEAMPEREEPEIGDLLDGDGSQVVDRDATDSLAHAWQVVLDAQLRLEDGVSSLRQNVMVTAAVLVLATPILARFLILTRPETLLISLLPALLLIAGGSVDLFWYDQRIRALGAKVDRLEEAHPDAEHLTRARDEATGQKLSRAGLIGFYAIPTVVFLGITAWRFF